MHFLSDNAAGVCPEVLAAVAEAAAAAPHGYDDDAWTARLDAAFEAFFGAPCAVFPVASGTAANALALATMVPPWGAVVCHEEAHIHVDECGAPEFFTGGAKLLLARGAHGKLNATTIGEALAGHRGDVHQVQPGALSLTQATEAGTVYTTDEVAALAADAHARGWRVHMDGARFANALAHLGCAPGEVTWRAGIDALSFGTIKNGGMSADAVVLFDDERADELRFRRKRAGHMPSKGRMQAAQLLAMIETGAFLANARRANEGARRLAEAAGDRLVHPVEANEVFVRVGLAGSRRLRADGFEFYDWGPEGAGEARMVVAWDAPEAHVEALCGALQAL